MRWVATFVLMLLLTSPAYATRYWVATSGSDANACAAIDGAEDPGVYKASPQGVSACLTAAGDIATIKSGTYTGSTAKITSIPGVGTAANPIIIEGDPSSSTTCSMTSTCPTIWRPSSGNVTVLTDESYITISNLAIDNVNNKSSYPIGIQGTSNHITISNVEAYGTQNAGNSASGIFSNYATSFVTVTRSHIHDIGDTSVGSDHGLYLSGDDNVIEYNWIHDAANLGVQCYTASSSSDGRADRCIVRYNLIEDNGASGMITDANDAQIYGNVIRNNGTHGILIGYSGGLRAKVYNNTIYNNGGTYGLRFGNFGSASNSEAKNNVIFGHTTEISVDASSLNVTLSNNACTSADSCGTTNKLTIAALTDILVSTSDPTLKSASSASDAGVSVGFTFCGSAPSIGAFEMPTVVAASIVGNLLDVTICNAAPSIQPLGTWTPACTGGGCGTPVASTVSLLGGSGGIVRVDVGGITGGACDVAQTWTISASGGNTDSASVGGQYNQSLHTITSFAVDSSACDGTGAPSIPGSPLALYEFDGNTNDSSGNGNHAIGSGSISYGTGKYGQGVQTTVGVNSYVDTGLLSGTNPSSTHVVIAIGVYIDPAQLGDSADIFGTTLGTNQKLIVYRNSSNIWKMIIQGTTGSDSEFPVVSGWTHVCLKMNATTDVATLNINGVAGTTSGASTISYTSYTLPSTLRFGLPSGFATSLSGQHIFDQAVIYTSDVSCADIYATWEPSTTVATATQAGHQWQGVYVTDAGVAENRGAANAQRTAVNGGAAAVMVQVNNETGGSIVVQPRFRYNINGGDFTNVVPDSPTADGISFWGSSTPVGLNNGIADGPITGALTHTDSISIVTSLQIPTLSMADNTSYTLRGIFHVDAAVGNVVCFKIYDQGGSALGSYTPSEGACLTVIATQATGAH